FIDGRDGGGIVHLGDPRCTAGNTIERAVARSAPPNDRLGDRSRASLAPASGRSLPAMLLRRSAFVHVLPLGPGRLLIVHAVSQLRLAVDDEAAALLDAFANPCELPAELASLAARFGQEPRTLAGAIAALVERGFLTEHDSAAEASAFARELSQTGARDPAALLDRYRERRHEGARAYWAAQETRPLASLAASGRRLDVALIGDCDVQMEAEYLCLEGRARGLDLHVAAALPDDPGFVGERRFDAILVGASRAR